MLENAVYVRFGDGDDVLAVPPMEVARVRETSRAARVIDWREAGYVRTADAMRDIAGVAANLLHARGRQSAAVHPRMPAGIYLALQAADVAPRVEPGLFGDERRRKGAEEVAAIHAAQRAAEAACAEAIARIGVAEIRDGLLWEDGRPLTSEHLRGVAAQILTGLGYRPGEMIIAGGPQGAMPHERGRGQLPAGAPIVLDIFPAGERSRYNGDLTRTVVAGEVPPDVTRMHAAVAAAHRAALDLLRDGADGREVHRAACAALVAAGYSTTTEGLEGPPGVAVMNHSLGHGVGLAVHEAPLLADLRYELREGDVVSIEPGLYLEGYGGVRIEDTVLITAGGYRNLSSLPVALDPRAYL